MKANFKTFFTPQIVYIVVTEKKTCSECGSKISKSHFSRHKDSRKCEYQADQKQIREQNLAKVPNSSRFRNRLEEMGYKVERLASNYDYKRPQRYNANTLSYRYFAKQSGIEKVKDELLISPRKNGHKANITVKEDEYWVCETESKKAYVIHLDPLEDNISRKRVVFLENLKEQTKAYSGNGKVIGKAVTPEQIPENWTIHPSSVLAGSI